jgi:hypothetical protein
MRRKENIPETGRKGGGVGLKIVLIRPKGNTAET